MENARLTTLKPIKLLHITDSHLGARSSETLLGLNTEQSLRDVLQEASTCNEDFDFIITTGDISNDGSVASYERYVNTVREYFPETPLIWLDGNHDSPTSMTAVSCERPIELKFVAGAWECICLSSRIPFEEGGALNSDELSRLDDFLRHSNERPVFIFLHHQPVSVGSAWVDNYVVKNSDEFFSVIDKYDNVKAIAWGHVHQSFECKRKSVSLFATPSTCIQFKPNSQFFEVDKSMPGYRVFTLHENGQLDAKMHRISERDYPIDYVSTGY